MPDAVCLRITDITADDIHQIPRVLFCDKFVRVNTLRQKADIIKRILPLGNIEAFHPVIIHNGFQAVVIVLQHFFRLFQRTSLIQHQRYQINFVDIAVDGTAFCRDAVSILYMGRDLEAGCSVIFIGVFQQILQHKPGLQFVVELFPPSVFKLVFNLIHMFSPKVQMIISSEFLSKQGSISIAYNHIR